MGDLSQRIESAQAQLKQAYITRAAYRDGLQANLDALASQIDASPSMREAIGAEFKRLAPLPQKVHEFLDISRERPVQLPDTDYEAFTQLFEREGALGKLFHEAGYESKLGNVRRSLRTLAEPHAAVLKAREALHGVCSEAGKPFMPMERAVHAAFKENRRIAPAVQPVAPKPVSTPVLKLVEPAPAPAPAIVVAEPAIVPQTPVVSTIAPVEEIAHAAPAAAPKPGLVQRVRTRLRGEPAEGFPRVEPLHPMTDLDPDKAWPPEKLLGESIAEPMLELTEQAPPVLKAVPATVAEAPKVVQGRTEYRATGHERAAREAAGHASDAPYYLSDELAREEHTKILGKVARAERTAAAEAPPSILRGMRQKLSKFWVRVDGLGEPAIAPLTPATQPASGPLFTRDAIDFTQPITVRQAMPNTISSTLKANVMPQKMQAEPRFAPLEHWLEKPPAAMARNAVETTPIAKVAEKVAHACGTGCGHGHSHAHASSVSNTVETAAKSGRKGWLLAGAGVVAGVAAIVIGSHRRSEQQRDANAPESALQR